jgi:hypothetical protein
MSNDHLKETTMKSHSTASILAAVVVASFASIALLAPIHQAMAAKGGNARAAMTQTKVNTGMPNRPAGKLQCVGPGCPGAKANAVKATTTGTYKLLCRPGEHSCSHGH